MLRSKWLKGSLVIIGAVLLSTIGIFAADSLQGIDGGIGQIAGTKGSGVCMEGSVPFTVGERVLCVDVYEATPSKDCPYQNPNSVMQSEENAAVATCYASSVSEKTPWIFVSLSQAQRMCAKSGKRLLTSKEWYHMALGTNVEECVIHENSAQNTGTEACVSTVGAYDAVGNVWEWVDEQVNGTAFDGRTLPEEGYVTSVDAQGVAITSSQSPDELYGKDYLWSKSEGVFGMIRGGFYASNQDAGLYTINASVPTNFATQGVGFRCVKDVF